MFVPFMAIHTVVVKPLLQTKKCQPDGGAVGEKSGDYQGHKDSFPRRPWVSIQCFKQIHSSPLYNSDLLMELEEKSSKQKYHDQTKKPNNTHLLLAAVISGKRYNHINSRANDSAVVTQSNQL